MQAARLHAYGGALVLDDVPVPTPGPGEVVLAVEGAGFCHSDIHVIDGDLQVLSRMPMTLGHENAGRVAAVGDGVDTVKEGDPVAVFGGWGEGTCDYCVSGNEQLCVAPRWVGITGGDGGFAEFLHVPHERYLVRLRSLQPKIAAPLVDAALTPYRAITRSLDALQPDHKVLVIGVGGLGQYGIKLLRILSGCEVIAVDVSSGKLATAVQYGATDVVDGRGDRVAEEVMELTNGAGVCASFDFVGSDQTLDLAVRSTRTLGKVVQLGLAGGSARLKVLDNAKFEVRFETSLWGNIKELREVIALAESGVLSPIEMEFAPLTAINDVYRRVKEGAVDGRVVITP
ncbi:MAG TPA: NAD(P)-dependent alcohol dehydrogenase [Gemmatimonadaceae bacterium]|nr:NAD(P)-dependent alcohol dehydrogenase [Gemmatimonadaceae bacterium]